MSRLSVSSADLNSCGLVFFKRRWNRSHLCSVCSFSNYSYWLNICKSPPKLKATCKETPKGYCNLPTTSNCPSVLKDADLRGTFGQWHADMETACSLRATFCLISNHPYAAALLWSVHLWSSFLCSYHPSSNPTHPPVPSLLHLFSFKLPHLDWRTKSRWLHLDLCWVVQRWGLVIKSRSCEDQWCFAPCRVSCGIGGIRKGQRADLSTCLPACVMGQETAALSFVRLCLQIIRWDVLLLLCPFSNDTACYGYMCFWRYMSRVRH